MRNSDSRTKLVVGARSERGLREENQDQMTGFSTSLGEVYLVADGMGGHRGGAEASRMVAEGYRSELTSYAPTMPMDAALHRATAAVNQALLTQGQSDDPSTRGMGSTVVLVALQKAGAGQSFLVGHVGDSRAYLLRRGVLRRLTSDHSMVQRMVDEKLITPEEARNHPNSNVLTRALGQQPDVAIELSTPEPLEPGDRIVLCSDGLWGYVADDAIAQVAAATPDSQAIAEKLVALALEGGSDDNITVQVVHAEPAPEPVGGHFHAPAMPSLAKIWLPALVVGLLLGAGLVFAYPRIKQAWANAHPHVKPIGPGNGDAGANETVAPAAPTTPATVPGNEGPVNGVVPHTPSKPAAGTPRGTQPHPQPGGTPAPTPVTPPPTPINPPPPGGTPGNTPGNIPGKGGTAQPHVPPLNPATPPSDGKQEVAPAPKTKPDTPPKTQVDQNKDQTPN